MPWLHDSLTVQHISHYLLEPKHIRLNLFCVATSNNAFVHYAAQKLAKIYWFSSKKRLLKKLIYFLQKMRFL